MIQIWNNNLAFKAAILALWVDKEINLRGQLGHQGSNTSASSRDEWYKFKRTSLLWVDELGPSHYLWKVIFASSTKKFSKFFSSNKKFRSLGLLNHHKSHLGEFCWFIGQIMLIYRTNCAWENTPNLMQNSPVNQQKTSKHGF